MCPCTKVHTLLFLHFRQFLRAQCCHRALATLADTLDCPFGTGTGFDLRIGIDFRNWFFSLNSIEN